MYHILFSTRQRFASATCHSSYVEALIGYRSSEFKIANRRFFLYRFGEGKCCTAHNVKISIMWPKQKFGYQIYWKSYTLNWNKIISLKEFCLLNLFRVWQSEFITLSISFNERCLNWGSMSSWIYRRKSQISSRQKYLLQKFMISEDCSLVTMVS